jgi:GT2 family glycosyltransferase
MDEKRGVLVSSNTLDPKTGVISDSGVTADLRRLTFKVATSAESINCLPTRALFAHWGDVRKIGGFHPRLLPHYLSDYEYTIRAHNLGFKCESSSELLIISNEETTGYRKITDRGFRSALSKLFSKKASSNPLYWSTFVLLAVPPRWVIPGLLRIWAGGAKLFLRFSINRFSPARKAG